MKIRKKDIGPIVIIFVLVIVTVLLIYYFKIQKTPVQPRDYTARIKVHTDQASQRNLNALKLYELSVNKLIKEYEPKLGNAAREAAKEIASYTSCCAIVYYLAWDKIKNQNETEAYMNKKIKPLLDPVMHALAKDMNRVVQDFDYELRRSTVQLAFDLAKLKSDHGGADLKINVDEMSHLDIQQSLHNLGFNVVGIGIGIIFDTVALYKSQLLAPLWKKITAIAATMFGKQIAKLATLPALAAADGPLPIGDILALLGGIWTGYDIYAAQKEFEIEINASLGNLLTEAQNSAHKQVIAHATTLVMAYQKVQDEIGTQTLDQIAKGSN